MIILIKGVGSGSIYLEAVANILEYCDKVNIDGLAQGSSDSIANALELLQSCTKPLICGFPNPVIQVTWTGFDMWTFTDVCWRTRVNVLSHIAGLVVNYGISNTIVLEIS